MSNVEKTIKEIKTLPSGTKIITVDDHHKVLPFWEEAVSSGLFPRGGLVVHVDQHSDMRPYEGELHVGNFLTYALQEGLIGDVLQVRTEYTFFRLDVEQIKKPYILDIDLDFWVPMMGIDFQKSLPVVRRLIDGACLVTIATSPGFIDQDLAMKLLDEILEM